ncbi:MAG TPA: hypothetical protein VF133_07880 [Terriglobales bacterium]
MPHLLRLPVLTVVVSLVFGAAGAQAQAASGSQSQTVSAAREQVTIPGPLRSFLRMAGISQKVSSEEVMPLLARNVYVQGYIGWQEHGRPTEFLLLLGRYVTQARELSTLAGAEGTIQIPDCAHAEGLLHILGFRLRGECGQKDASLVTADAERAFLTTDSGFPLNALEQSLRNGQPFSYHFPESRVPVLFTENVWRDLGKSETGNTYDLVELLLRRPAIARLYWAMSRMDPETRTTLLQAVGLKRLLTYAPDLDFYGTHIAIRNGKVQVPGGAKAEDAWKDLVGASPQAPAEFVPKLLAKDKGWLAAYFDCFARINFEQQQRFTSGNRLKTFYTAFRSTGITTDAARPAFRLAPGLLLLLTRVQFDADGQPLVPGGLDVWKEVLSQKTDYKVVRDWHKHAKDWTRPDQLLEAMFAFSRLDTDRSPLQMYLLFSELDEQRAPEHRLKPPTIRLLARRFDQYSDQYPIFSEFPELDDAAMTTFVNVADAVDHISNHVLRGNAMGSFQANMGLWQILARQQEIPQASLNESWQEVLNPFAKINSGAELFDATTASLSAISRASTGKTAVSQDEFIELLAGPKQSGTEGQHIHQEVAKNIRSVMDGQRLVSLDTLLALGKGLKEMEHGATIGSSLVPLAGELREFEMPRPIFTSSERNEWAAGIYNNRHTELQMQTDMSKLLKGSASAAQLEEARGQLTSFLRDTLVGMNYAYYEPPGSQLLRTNPLFVRSHDFSGDTVAGVEDLWHAAQLFGQGTPAGGGVHLVGSLADLPYVLSEAEQDFITPENVQALIWRESVPGLLTDAILPRWWHVSRTELHAVALYQRAGEELLGKASSDNELRGKVISILSERMAPDRLASVDDDLQQGNGHDAITWTTPADTLYLTEEFRRRFPQETGVWGPSGQELDGLLHQDANELTWERISRDFGVPHRILADSYGQELLNMKPFPAFAGYSSRLMAESWDSNNLYWARLADEKGIPPVQLNLLVPELTRLMVEKIFATDFEDWTALLRAMREAGDEFREGKVSGVSATASAVPPQTLH